MTADVEHPERDDAWRSHRPAYSDMCPLCSIRLDRSDRISRLHAAFMQFGYSALTREEVADAYDLALTREPTAEDGIIAMLTRSQLRDAGIVSDRPVTDAASPTVETTPHPAAPISSLSGPVRDQVVSERDVSAASRGRVGEYE